MTGGFVNKRESGAMKEVARDGGKNDRLICKNSGFFTAMQSMILLEHAHGMESRYQLVHEWI